MRKKKRPFWLLGFTFLSLVSLIYLIFNFDPFFQLSVTNIIPNDTFKSSTIPVIFLFFIALFIFIFFLFTFLLKNKRRGLIFSAFIVSYLILRLQNLTQIFFLLILAAIFLTLELTFSRQK